MLPGDTTSQMMLSVVMDVAVVVGNGMGAISTTPAMSVYTKIMESGPTGAASASGVLLCRVECAAAGT
jgi:hypothetical protein